MFPGAWGLRRHPWKLALCFISESESRIESLQTRSNCDAARPLLPRATQMSESSRQSRSLIALDARYVRERPSGIGAMVEALVDLVPAQMPDVDFLVLKHPRAPASFAEGANVRGVVVPYEANGPVTLLALSCFVDLRGVNLFHAPANIMPAGLRMRTLVTIHDLMWIHHPVWCGATGGWGYVQTKFYQNGLWRALKHADHLIAISEGTRREIIETWPSAEARCSVVVHGVANRFRVAEPKYQTRIDALRARVAPGAEAYVLVVGRAAPYKNQRSALEGFLRAFATEPSVHLVVVQRLGNETREFLARAESVGARERVHVVEPLSEQDLVCLYQGALCLCHPSLQEGWGMPISEAMACGCPVVTSSVSVMPEVARDAALYVDPRNIDNIAQALRRMWSDSSCRARLRALGLRRAQELSWKAHAERTSRVYRRLLADRRS